MRKRLPSFAERVAGRQYRCRANVMSISRIFGLSFERCDGRVGAAEGERAPTGYQRLAGRRLESCGMIVVTCVETSVDQARIELSDGFGNAESSGSNAKNLRGMVGHP